MREHRQVVGRVAVGERALEAEVSFFGQLLHRGQLALTVQRALGEFAGENAVFVTRDQGSETTGKAELVGDVFGHLDRAGRENPNLAALRDVLLRNAHGLGPKLWCDELGVDIDDHLGKF